jgi:hypothetical protein
MDKFKLVDVCFLDLETKKVSHTEVKVPENSKLTHSVIEQACLEEVKRRSERCFNEQSSLYEAARNKYNMTDGALKEAISWDVLPLPEKKKYGYDPMSDYFKKYSFPTGEIIAWSLI